MGQLNTSLEVSRLIWRTAFVTESVCCILAIEHHSSHLLRINRFAVDHLAPFLNPIHTLLEPLAQEITGRKDVRRHLADCESKVIDVII